MTYKDLMNMDPKVCPQICLSNGFTSLFGFLISCVMKGEFWNHAQWLYEPGVIATQSYLFHKADITKKMVDRHSLKFMAHPSWGEAEYKKLRAAIDARLALPWWERRYDVLAVIGELLGWHWLHMKGLDFCSENVVRILAKVDPRIKKWSLYNRTPRPEQLNEWLKAHGYVVTGRIDPD